MAEKNQMSIEGQESEKNNVLQAGTVEARIPFCCLPLPDWQHIVSV